MRREFIYKVSTVLSKLSSKNKQKVRSFTKHNGRNDQIKVGNSFGNILKDKVQSQLSKTAKGREWNDKFRFKLNLESQRACDQNLANIQV